VRGSCLRPLFCLGSYFDGLVAISSTYRLPSSLCSPSDLYEITNLTPHQKWKVVDLEEASKDVNTLKYELLRNVNNISIP
jgi:hypothetical protein